MSKADFAALIALCAALASAIGDGIRQRSAQEITDKEVGHLELFRLSVRDARWWLGGMGAIANYSLQAAALALGSVMLVTALQVTSLPTVTVAKPVVASMLGVVVLGETLNTSGPRVLTLLTAGVLVAVATVVLARGEAASMAAGAGHDVVLRDRSGVESLAETRGARVFIGHVSTVAWKISCEEG
jgi:O-antigen ligase